MRKLFFFLFFLASFLQLSFAQQRTVKIKLIHTTDIHGNYFPYDFVGERPFVGSLARVSAFVNKQRESYHYNVLLFDNGDILQGQPSSYYYNYIDTTSVHLCAAMMNEMGYDVGNMGNHDVETGINVFTRWAKECNFPILCANGVVTATGKLYFKPYEVFVRDGVKIAVLGMITSAIPCWLSDNIYQGLQFDDMEATARKWIPIIKEKEKPDIIVGLFHSGIDAMTMANKYREDASMEVAERVPGFDVVMVGHDHQQYCKWIKNIAGKSVLIINPGKNGVKVSNVDITVVKDGDKLVSKKIVGQLSSTAETEVDSKLVNDFNTQYNTLRRFVSTKLGTMAQTISIHSAFFGPNAFIDAIHFVQLDMTKADVSFAAPFSFNSEIKKGDFLLGDLFSLYEYENKLDVMTLTGLEIKNYLEMSYSNWFNQMKTRTDHLFLLDIDKKGVQFKNFLFNFDSAAGIIYTVDVTKPRGQKIQILKMTDGTPFSLDKTYRVVLNSYRGNGGGELLTKGAGIPQDQLKSRIIYCSDYELRYYLAQYIKKNGTSFFHPLNEWKLIPEDWTTAAAQRDAALIFNASDEDR
jgi:2',3'-cyclic-nucleotide 2'-phosphodiesterase/3'-nucleotidase